MAKRQLDMALPHRTMSEQEAQGKRYARNADTGGPDQPEVEERHERRGFDLLFVVTWVFAILYCVLAWLSIGTLFWLSIGAGLWGFTKSLIGGIITWTIGGMQ